MTKPPCNGHLQIVEKSRCPNSSFIWRFNSTSLYSVAVDTELFPYFAMPLLYLVQPSNLRPLHCDTMITALNVVNPKLGDEIKSTRWYTLGYVLGLSEEALERIEQCSKQGRLQIILSEWLSLHAQRATWQAFVEALRSPLLQFQGNAQLADQIDVWCSWQGTDSIQTMPQNYFMHYVIT